VLTNQGYIRFSRANCVEIMCMQDIDKALAEKPDRAKTYRTKDAYGDEIECFESFPGVTVDQLRKIGEGEALTYMQGSLMPYTAVIDPHTLKDMIGIRRGEATSAQAFIEVISRHVKSLKERYGPGIDRSLWDFVKESQVQVDLLLGEEKVVEALELCRKMEDKAARQPEALQRRVEATRDVVMHDAADRLDALDALLGQGRRKEVRRELDRLARLLEGTPLAERAAALRSTASRQDNGGQSR